MVVVNGVEVVHCDGIVEEGMNYRKLSKQTRKRDGYFVRRSQNINTYVIPEAIDIIMHKSTKLSIVVEDLVHQYVLNVFKS